jgi:hypothetical protein
MENKNEGGEMPILTAEETAALLLADGSEDLHSDIKTIIQRVHPQNVFDLVELGSEFEEEPEAEEEEEEKEPAEGEDEKKKLKKKEALDSE